MVRHHAPCVHPVFGQIEMSQRFGDNICDPRVGKKTSACAGIQLRLDLFAEQLFEPSFVRRRKRRQACLLRGDDDALPLELEFLTDGSRQGVGKAKSDEVSGLVRLPMWEPAARSDCGHAGEFNSKRTGKMPTTKSKEPAGCRRYGRKFKESRQGAGATRAKPNRLS